MKGAQIREMSLATRFPRESDSDLWSDLQPGRGDEMVLGIADLGEAGQWQGRTGRPGRTNR